jgi:hypothetical protein
MTGELKYKRGIKAKNTAKNKNNTVFDYPPSPKDFFNLSSSNFFLIKYRSW